MSNSIVASAYQKKRKKNEIQYMSKIKFDQLTWRHKSIVQVIGISRLSLRWIGLGRL